MKNTNHLQTVYEDRETEALDNGLNQLPGDVGVKPWVSLRRQERIRQIAHVSGKKRHSSLKIHLEMNDLDAKHELAIAATLFWAQACWVGKHNEVMHAGWKRQHFEAITHNEVRQK